MQYNISILIQTVTFIFRYYGFSVDFQINIWQNKKKIKHINKGFISKYEKGRATATATRVVN